MKKSSQKIAAEFTATMRATGAALYNLTWISKSGATHVAGPMTLTRVREEQTMLTAAGLLIDSDIKIAE